jgi:sarcosine oxidase subunit gamma
MTAEPEGGLLAHRADDLSSLDRRTNGLLAAWEMVLPLQLSLRSAPEETRSNGVVLPLEPNTTIHETSVDVLWLGPDEWLLAAQSGAGSVTQITDDIRERLVGTHHALADVTAARAVIDLYGVHWAHFLAQGCSLDLDPTRWIPGTCAQTVLSKAPVLLEALTHRIVRLYIRASFADHVVDWLMRAARDPEGLALGPDTAMKRQEWSKSFAEGDRVEWVGPESPEDPSFPRFSERGIVGSIDPPDEWVVDFENRPHLAVYPEGYLRRLNDL